ncbi:MAG: class I SAM-dependent methyltransferase [bacterium]
MAERMTHHAGSLFDFGPLAREYERWYDTPAGQAHDCVQKDDVRRLLYPASAGQTLLDIGCGTGHWSAFFVGMGYQVTGVDIAPEMIKVAQTKVPECSFQVADAYDLPFDNGTFDVVAAMATLEFLSDQAMAIREMARCTKKDGHILIGTLNRLAPLNQHRISKGKQPYASAHLVSPAELRSLLTPWGCVRMLASSSSGHGHQPPLPIRIVGRIAGLRGRLNGPFIVAEVRL